MLSDLRAVFIHHGQKTHLWFLFDIPKKLSRLVSSQRVTFPLTRVNLEHISSASFTMPAFSMYLAHLELMNLSAVSRACASSIHWAASLMFPACWGRRKRSMQQWWQRSRNTSESETKRALPCKSWLWWGRVRWAWACSRWPRWCILEPASVGQPCHSAAPGSTAPRATWLAAPPYRHLWQREQSLNILN